MSITKRSHLLAAIAAVCLSFAAGAARAEDGVLRVGIITDMSGQYSDGNGPGSVIAAQMAAEEIGGTVAGRKIEIISADHQNKPDVATGIVRNWIDNKGVDVIAEGVNSAVALAIQTVTRERKKLFLISGSGSSDLTGKQCSRTSVQWTYDTYASSNATAKAVVARGAARVLVTDGPHAVAEAMAGAPTLTVTPPAVTVARVTGAGDCFLAAHLAAELNHQPRDAALRQAVDAAAAHVSGKDVP